MKRTIVLAFTVMLLAGACGSDTATDATTSTSTTVPATVTTTTTASLPTTTTLAATTTTTTAAPRLSADTCDQLDVEEMSIALGVEAVEAGSPFGTDTNGTQATCRYGVTFNGNFGSAFTIAMHAPSTTGAFEDLMATLSVGDGDGTAVVGLGVRAFFYTADESGYTALMLVEYDNGTAAYTYADSDDLYQSTTPEAAMQAILSTVVGPVLLAIG